MELADYLRIARRHWLGIAVIVAVVVALAGVITLAQPKVYAADASGYVQIGPADDPALSSVNDTLAKSRVVNYAKLATSRATAESVAEALDIADSPSELVSRITVTQPEDTAYLDITARADTPLEAQRLADAWVVALATQVKRIEDPQGRERVGTPQVLPVEAAALPSAPISPNPLRNLALGLALGLLVAFGYSVVRNTLDKRIRTPEEIESKFGVSVVGTIPAATMLRRGEGEPAALVVDTAVNSQASAPTSEAFRKLRTNLMFMNVDNPPRVVVITSPLPGDGKSTVSANLAAAIESSGQPVVLVDGDLRRPTVATEFQLVEGVGLTDVLAGRIPLEDALQSPAKHPGLWVLAAGSIPPNPSELLGSQAMYQLLQKLSSEAMVLVDAPPLLPVTDAAVLAANADGAFIVVSSGKTHDDQLDVALQNLSAVDAKPLGVILNRVARRDVGSGFYGEYYGREAPPAPKPGRSRTPGKRIKTSSDK